MVQTTSLKELKVEKVANARSLIGAFDGEVIDGEDGEDDKSVAKDMGQFSKDIVHGTAGQNSNDIVDVSENINRSECDHLVARKFILVELVEHQERTFKTVSGVQIQCCVDRSNWERRLMTVWRTNAHNVSIIYHTNHQHPTR